MGKKSKIAELGVLDMLNQMKNPLTNIRLALEMLEKTPEDGKEYRAIIRNSAITLEKTIRDLCRSFDELGVSIHIESDTAEI